MKKTLSYILPVLALAACSDSDKWTPGPQDAPGSALAYFPEQTTYDFVFISGEDCKGTVTIKRNATESEADVPLTFDTDLAAWSGPQTAHFPAGVGETTLTYDFDGNPYKQSFKFNITIPDDSGSLYAAGVSKLNLTVYIGDWELMCETVTYDYLGKFENTTAPLYHLEGTNKYRFDNFLNSGLDCIFNLNGEADGQKLFFPVNNFTDFETGADAYGTFYDWYIYDEAGDFYPYIYPNGEDFGNGYEYFLMYGSDSYVQFSKRNGRLMGYVYYLDGTESWTYINLKLSKLLMEVD